MKTTLLASALALSLGAAAHADTWGIDPSHTDVIASWDHAGFSRQALAFHEFDGVLELDLDDIEAARADFTIAVASLSTGLEMFDAELTGANFLDAANHPSIRFVSTSVERTGDMTVTVAGDLTIKGVTNPASFDVTVHAVGDHPVGQFFDAYKGTWMGFTATTEIRRSDWGVDGFIPIGSDMIEIEINTELREGGFAM